MSKSEAEVVAKKLGCTAYKCKVCKRWHVGNLLIKESK